MVIYHGKIRKKSSSTKFLPSRGGLSDKTQVGAGLLLLLLLLLIFLSFQQPPIKHNLFSFRGCLSIRWIFEQPIGRFWEPKKVKF